MTSLTIHIPLPPKVLSPNAPSPGRHWKKKADAIKAYREFACAVAIEAMYDLPKRPQWKHATIKAVFYKPGSNDRKADPDNLIASIKSAVDGLKDAKLLHDDRELVWLPPEQRIGKAAEGVQGVEITVTPVIEVMTDAKPLEAP